MGNIICIDDDAPDASIYAEAEIISSNLPSKESIYNEIMLQLRALPEGDTIEWIPLRMRMEKECGISLCYPLFLLEDEDYEDVKNYANDHNCTTCEMIQENWHRERLSVNRLKKSMKLKNVTVS